MFCRFHIFPGIVSKKEILPNDCQSFRRYLLRVLAIKKESDEGTYHIPHAMLRTMVPNTEKERGGGESEVLLGSNLNRLYQLCNVRFPYIFSWFHFQRADASCNLGANAIN